jgi:hypothetical protein
MFLGFISLRMCAMEISQKTPSGEVTVVTLDHRMQIVPYHEILHEKDVYKPSFIDNLLVPIAQANGKITFKKEIIEDESPMFYLPNKKIAMPASLVFSLICARTCDREVFGVVYDEKKKKMRCDMSYYASDNNQTKKYTIIFKNLVSSVILRFCLLFTKNIDVFCTHRVLFEDRNIFLFFKIPNHKTRMISTYPLPPRIVICGKNRLKLRLRLDRIPHFSDIMSHCIQKDKIMVNVYARYVGPQLFYRFTNVNSAIEPIENHA